MKISLRWPDMCLGWGIVILCMGLSPWGVAAAQQDSSGNATTTSQPPQAETPRKDTPVEQKKETPAEQKKETSAEQKKEAPAEPAPAPPEQTPQQAPPQQTTPPAPAPAEPATELQAQPQPSQIEIEPLPSEPANEPDKKADLGGGSANSKRHGAKKRVTSTDGSPQKIIVRHGSTEEPTAQIVTGMAPEEANRQRQHAEQLLRSTEETLKRVDMLAFTPAQQETVSQIHNYMDDARLALKGGDIARGHTLAQKAGLLVQDLAKHSQAAKQANSDR